MRILISFTTLCVIVLTFGLVAGAQTKKAKAKSKSAPVAATTQEATTPPTGTNYIGETEKGNGKAGNNAVFEPNDANTWKTNKPSNPKTKTAGTVGTQPANNDGQIFDIFDPSGRSPKNGNAPETTKVGTGSQKAASLPGGTATPNSKGKPPGSSLYGDTIVVSSKTAPPSSTPSKKTTKPKASTTKRKP